MTQSGFGLCTLYEVVARDAQGHIKWTDYIHNTVTTEGLNKVLDAAFKTGLASPAWYVGLKETGSVVAGDTLASHAGWAENTGYSGTRKAWTPGTIASGSVDNSGSPAVFTFTGAATIAGLILASVTSGTSGTLFGGGDFTGSKTMANGETLTVTATIPATSV